MSDLKLTSSTITAKQPVQASVTLTNASDIAGAQVVQLYTHQRAGSSSRPGRELKVFRKVMLAPHATQTVELTLEPEQLSYWSASLRHRVLESGTFDVWVGTDSAASLHTTFSLNAK